MEFVSLKTNEEISSLTIGDQFQSDLSGARYLIVDLTRDSRSKKIVSLKTEIITPGNSKTNDEAWWNMYAFMTNCEDGHFKKIITNKDYDPTQQPYTDDDI